ncbi:MAG: MarR family transcriptional regulator [Pseudomonadota bacterium]
MTVLESHADTALSKDRLRVWLKLLKVTRGMEAELRERMRVEFGSTLPRFDVMAALARHPGGLRMSGLSDVLRVSNGNVTGIVDRLVAEGQVARAQVPGDRRAQLVRLTPAGQAEFLRMARTHEAWVDALMADLDARDAAALLAGLGRLDRLEGQL